MVRFISFLGLFRSELTNQPNTTTKYLHIIKNNAAIETRKSIRAPNTPHLVLTPDVQIVTAYHVVHGYLVFTVNFVHNLYHRDNTTRHFCLE